MTHPRLSTLPPNEQREEIFRSREILCGHFGDITAFAYPFGSALDYDSDSVTLARDAGFNLAVSNRYGVHVAGDSRWECRRIWIDRSDSMKSFQAKVRGDLDALRLLDSGLGIRIRRWMNALLRAG
jgi:peptidoglycan/xylan/chitin deacetylase (PgdA/CDA1 family)